LTSSVLSGLQEHLADETILYEAIEEKAQPADVPLFLSLQASLSAAYAIAIAAFS
jgi:hypothetical protein